MEPPLDATAQAELVRSGAVSARELVESSIERIEALNGDLKVTRRTAQWWESGHDLLLTPTMALPPAELGTIGIGDGDDGPLMPIVRATPHAIFTAGFNNTGQPAISLPLHQTAEGLPIGVQL